MRPIRTVESNFTFLGPSPEVADLPGRVDVEDGRFTAVYELDDQEREWIAKGGQVRIGISQLPIPPISLGIVKLEEAPGEEQEGVPVKPDYRCRCGALYVNERAIALDFTCGHCAGTLRLPGAAE